MEEALSPSDPPLSSLHVAEGEAWSLSPQQRLSPCPLSQSPVIVVYPQAISRPSLFLTLDCAKVSLTSFVFGIEIGVQKLKRSAV